MDIVLGADSVAFFEVAFVFKEEKEKKSESDAIFVVCIVLFIKKSYPTLYV